MQLRPFSVSSSAELNAFRAFQLRDDLSRFLQPFDGLAFFSTRCLFSKLIYDISMLDSVEEACNYTRTFKVQRVRLASSKFPSKSWRVSDCNFFNYSPTSKDSRLAIQSNGHSRFNIAINCAIAAFRDEMKIMLEGLEGVNYCVTMHAAKVCKISSLVLSSLSSFVVSSIARAETKSHFSYVKVEIS